MIHYKPSGKSCWCGTQTRKVDEWVANGKRPGELIRIPSTTDVSLVTCPDCLFSLRVKLVVESAVESAKGDAFLRAYDAWAISSDLCGGPLFDRMLEARADLDIPQPEPDLEL